MPTNPWMRVSVQAWLLDLEATNVVALRMLRLAAGGPAAAAEIHRMFAEKLVAASMLQSLAVIGALGSTAPNMAAKSLRHYRRIIRANRRRLAGESPF
jgi:hypothetical protein